MASASLVTLTMDELASTLENDVKRRALSILNTQGRIRKPFATKRHVPVCAPNASTPFDQSCWYTDVNPTGGEFTIFGTLYETAQDSGRNRSGKHQRNAKILLPSESDKRREQRLRLAAQAALESSSGSGVQASFPPAVVAVTARIAAQAPVQDSTSALDTASATNVTAAFSASPVEPTLTTSAPPPVSLAQPTGDTVHDSSPMPASASSSNLHPAPLATTPPTVAPTAPSPVSLAQLTEYSVQGSPQPHAPTSSWNFGPTASPATFPTPFPLAPPRPFPASYPCPAPHRVWACGLLT